MFTTTQADQRSERLLKSVNSTKSAISMLVINHYLFQIDSELPIQNSPHKIKYVEDQFESLALEKKTDSLENARLLWGDIKNSLAFSTSAQDSFTLNFLIAEKSIQILDFLDSYRGDLGIDLSAEEIVRSSQSLIIHKVVLTYAESHLANQNLGINLLEDYNSLIESLNTGWKLLENSDSEDENYKKMIAKWKFIEPSLISMRSKKATPYIVSKFSNSIINDLT